MGQTIACANQKGGVGKTTTVVTWELFAGARGGIAGQCDGAGLGLDRTLLHRRGHRWREDRRADHAEAHGLDGAVGHRRAPRLSGSKAETTGTVAVRPMTTTTRLVDRPLSLGLLTVNALPRPMRSSTRCNAQAPCLEGLTQLLATLDLVRDHLNPELHQGDRPDDVRRWHQADVAAEVRWLGERVYDTVIPLRSVPWSEGTEPRVADFALLAGLEPRCRLRRVGDEQRPASRQVAADSGS